MHAKYMTRHKASTTCKRARVRRNNEAMQDKQFEAENVKFIVYGKEIERVREFRYLGRIFTENDDDTKCIQSQLKRARYKWNSISKILKREGANPITMAKFYLAVVQAVLLYGEGSWTITKQNLTKI